MLTLAALAVAAGASSGAAGDPALLAARERNPSLKSYSFHVDVAIRMQSFPWLRFHVDGTGNYERGRSYVVEFTHMPFFAKSFKSVDLSALDPTMWHKRFFVNLTGRKDGMATFELRERKIDPSDKNPLVAADVTLDSDDATRDVVLHYASGEIQLNLSPAETQGYRLPASSEVSIRMPGQALSAHADFTDYAIRQTTLYANTPDAGREQ